VIQAWYMDDSEEDQRLPHHKDPKEFVSLDKLAGPPLCVFQFNVVLSASLFCFTCNVCVQSWEYLAGDLMLITMKPMRI